jgi:hypothetical protein
MEIELASEKVATLNSLSGPGVCQMRHENRFLNIKRPVISY